MSHRTGRALDRATVRILAAHACGAIALSVPFPALVAALSDRSSGPLALGAAGASRMLPYVVLSWVAGIVADRVRRDLVVRTGLWLRLACGLGTVLALATDRPWLGVGLATLAVAISLPAYPALVAGLPSVAGRRSGSALEVLVTIEVGAFVVGGAIGGLMLQPATRPWIAVSAVVLTALAVVLFRGVTLAAPTSFGRPSVGHAYRVLLRNGPARDAVGVMCAINLVGAFVALALLPLARDTWGAGAEGYGLATAVLGFAALAAPLSGLLGGRTPRSSLRRMLPLLAIAVLLLLPSRSVGQAIPALAVLGAVSVGAEARATRILTQAVPDTIRGTVLGVNDAAIVAAAMLGTLLAPWALDVGSARLAFPVGATLLLLALLLCRRRHEVECSEVSPEPRPVGAL